MKDEDKTREQLISELVELRQRIAELKTSEAARKQAEEALRESEERYRTLVETMNDGLSVLDENNSFTYVNDRCCEITGYSRDELIGRSPLDFLEETSQKMMKEQMARRCKEGCGSYELDWIRKDGGKASVLVSHTHIVDSDGHFKGSFGVITDITERKQAEEALRESEERFHMLVETMSEGLSVLDENDCYTYVNGRFCEIIGYSRHELIGRSPLDFLDESNQTILKEQIARRRKGQRGFYDLEWIRKSGRTVSMSLSGAPIRGADGQFKGCFAVMTDITQRKRFAAQLARQAEELARQAEELAGSNAELRKSELRFRGLADTLPEIVVEIDAEGRLTYANDIAFEQTGYSRTDLARRLQVCQMVAPQDRERLREAFARLMRGERIGASEYTAQRKDGSTFPVVIHSNAILDEEGNAIGTRAIVMDITERKRAEQERLRTERLEAIGVLAGGLAHDFNNILAGILANVSLARRFGAEGSEDMMLERLAVAERACMQAADLTRQLLTFSRGGAPIKTTASISALIRDTVEFALRGSNVRCELSLADDLWAVEIDEGQMSQVISNMMINADEAMPEGGVVTVRAENVTVGARDGLPLEDGKYVKISIEDQGIGIPKEYLSRIFDPYFTTKQKGSGLGLATSYSIVRNHDGYITVESELGVGTTFYIYVPAPEKELPEKEAVEEALFIGQGRILVMDDQEMVREAAGRMLEYIGYEAELAEDVPEALELYQKAKEAGQPFDAVILDLTVPGGMGGKEAIVELLEIDPDVKAIVSSGYSDDPVMARFREYGFSGVIAKPYELEELSEVLHKVMMGVSG